MKRLAVLSALFATCAVLAAAPASAPPAEGIYRTDRLPMAKPIVSKEGTVVDGFFRYIRFYPDGVAVSVVSTGELAQVATWLNKESPNVRLGTYKQTPIGLCLNLARPASAETGGNEIYCGHFEGEDFVTLYDPKEKVAPKDAVFHKMQVAAPGT